MNNTSSELTLLQQEVLDLYHTEEWIEGLNLEFKSSKGGLPKDFWPTYSSFANTNGGIILLGVSDDGTIEGLSKPEQREKDLAVLLNDPQKCSSNLSFVPGMIEKVTIAGAIILAIKVPCAEPKDKPVYLNGHLECSYFRQHESDIQCNDAMLQQMLRDKTEASKDANIIPYSTIEDLDKHTFQQFRNRMGSFFPGHTWLADNDKTLLTKLGGYRRDRQTGEEGITLAGLLMFGTNESISEFFPQFQMNYYEFDDSEDIHKRWSDRITSDGTWTANLYQFFFRVLPRMNEGLKVPFKLNPDMTRQGESPAHIAVREALANAIVHADYHGDGGIIINKSSKKLELSNPGTLLVSREYIFTGGVSKCRNPSLQKMFQFMGIVDKAGSGVDKIVKGWFEQCLYLPQVKENRDPARVIWKLPYLGLLPLEKQKYLIHKIGSDKYAALSLAERIILIMIPEDHYVGHKEIRKSYSIHPTDLSKCLSKLTRNGYLKTQGVARSTKYCMAFSCQKNPESLAQSEESLAQSEESLAQSEESLAQSEESLAQSEESLAQSAAVRDILGLKWIPRAKMEKAILHLCTNRWVSCIQIASLFRRKPKSLQQNILRPLADHGLLELKYPETPNRPRQAYRTTSREADGIKKLPKDRK